MASFSFNRREIVLLTLFLASAFGALAAFATAHHDLVLLLKPLPALALAALLLPYPASYCRLLVAGLVASAAGDLLLELGPQRFLWGVGAFFLAHLAYIAAFLLAERRLAPLAALPALALGLVVFPRLLPGLEQQQLFVPVLVYTLALCAMFWRALARISRGASSAVIAGACGAAAFAASDSLLALARFSGDSEPIPHVRYAILGLYWLGQLGITLSAPRSFR